MKKKRRLLYGVALVATIGAVGTAWALYGRAEAAPTGRPHTVTRGDVIELAAASGSIEPSVQVEVKSRASGEVIEVLVEEGQTVEAGQLLFRLDPIDAERTVIEARTAAARARSGVAQAAASLAVAEAEARNAVTQRDVNTRGTEMGLVPAETARSASNAAEVAEANVTLRKAALAASRAEATSSRLAVDEAERRRKETDIVAPIAGTVLNVAVERGSIVASAVTNVGGGSALATIADLSDLRVIGQIDESQIGKVHVDQEATLRVNAYPNRGFTARVIRVSPLGVTETNVVTFDVELAVTDEEASLLRSGMSADIEIETHRIEDALLVPLVAIESVGPTRFVILGSGERREIETSANDGMNIVVTGGLEEGDRILIGASVASEAPAAASRGLLSTGRRRSPR